VEFEMMIHLHFDEIYNSVTMGRTNNAPGELPGLLNLHGPNGGSSNPVLLGKYELKMSREVSEILGSNGQ
jgi:hypothetical protein